MDPTIFARIALISAVLAISSPNLATPTPLAGYTIYVVQSGDTLASIATQFATTPDQISQVNHLGASAPLLPGEKLQVPSKATAAATPTVPPNALTYTVKSGDTLAKIASSFSISVDDLAKANNIQDMDSLSVGQELVIPGTQITLPDGIALNPTGVKQGNTLEFRITSSDVVSATGRFQINGQQAYYISRDLQFFKDNGQLYALAGIDRCNNTGTFPVTIQMTLASGESRTLSFNVRINATQYPIQDITLTPQMASLLDPVIEQAELNLLNRTLSAYNPERLWDGPFQMPLKVQDPPISALYGERRSYNGGAPGACGHEGQDFAVNGGTPVYAPAGGIVALAEPLKVRGNVVFINHGLGVFGGFYHLSEIDVKQGQRVNAGDLIGKVGTTGFSTGNHLHWSMWVHGVYVDPIEWTRRTLP